MGCANGKSGGKSLQSPVPQKGQAEAQGTNSPTGNQGKSPAGNPAWNQEVADKLQEAVDKIFGTSKGAGEGGSSLLGLEFSFSLADPSLEGCPLIGCSTGFTKLCGYDLNDIIGRNCRFLVDPVPLEMTDMKMRDHTKKYCEAVRDGKPYEIPQSEQEPWMPEGRPTDELLAVQKNARKNGQFFNNMFFMKVFELGADLGQEKPYIVGLQSELAEGKQDLEVLAKNLEQLDQKMAKVKKELTSLFFMRCSLNHQFRPTPSGFSSPEDGGTQGIESAAPANLHANFDGGEVKSWEQGQFKQVKKLAAATRNRGVVWLMEDEQSKQKFAVKAMPNSWIRESHADFLRFYPRQTEMPWMDIGCTRYLNSVNYKFACDLQGVYRSDEETFVVSSFASGGDLFDAAQVGEPPGIKRESAMGSMVVQVLTALQHLHDIEVVHRDVSLENVLITSKDEKNASVKLIDFGMAATGRRFANSPRGKASYEAPEMQNGGEYDAFLSDTFAAGVLVYALLLKDYPWLSTKPGQCKRFQYIEKNGLRAYCSNASIRDANTPIAKVASEHLMQLLEGMLCIKPEKRLSLGEKQCSDRRSVWDEPWLKTRLIESRA